MSKYRILMPLIAAAAIGVVPVADGKKIEMGTIVVAADTYWGSGEFMYCYFSAAVREKGLCMITPTFDATNKRYVVDALEVTNTAGMGRMLGVAVLPQAAGTYGWLQISGLTPINCAASVAADTVLGIGGVGQGGANSAGKQILGGRVAAAATTTSVKVATGSGPVGGFTFKVNNTDGWFVGGYVSGTGIAAASKVTAIDVDERLVTVSVATTAKVSGNITMTYNNAAIFYNLVHMNRPFAQGAIT